MGFTWFVIILLNIGGARWGGVDRDDNRHIYDLYQDSNDLSLRSHAPGSRLGYAAV